MIGRLLGVRSGQRGIGIAGNFRGAHQGIGIGSDRIGWEYDRKAIGVRSGQRGIRNRMGTG